MTPEEFEPTRFRTPAELLAEYRRHEKFLHGHASTPTAEELERASETERLRREYEESGDVVLGKIF